MQHSDDGPLRAPDAKGEARQRAEDPFADELAWLKQVAKLVRPLPLR